MPSKNTRLNYLYRDARNFKLFGSVVFSNPTKLSIEEIKHKIESRLIDGMYFDPDEWGVPRLHAEDFDEELDHGWCEFDGVEETTEKTTLGSVFDWLRAIDRGRNAEEK